MMLVCLVSVSGGFACVLVLFACFCYCLCVCVQAHRYGALFRKMHPPITLSFRPHIHISIHSSIALSCFAYLSEYLCGNGYHER